MSVVRPSTAVHCFVRLRTGVRMHFVEKGTGPAVVLCHGFPDLWYSWRNQINVLAREGYRVIAPDLRGYGETVVEKEALLQSSPASTSSSSIPPKAPIELFSMEHITNDLVALLESLDIPRAVFIGHDWGGAVVWDMARHHPKLVRAVGSLNTPFFPGSDVDPITKMTKRPGVFDYQLYFQEEGRAEEELEKDIPHTFKCLYREGKDDLGLSTAGVRKRGGLLVGLPAATTTTTSSSLLSPEQLSYYVTSYSRTGFRDSLNWYRNLVRNWEWNKKVAFQRVLQPALMITAGKDPVLKAEFSTGMEKWIPNLTRKHIQDCGHWTQIEHPSLVSQFLLSWLSTLPSTPSHITTPKL